MVMCDQRDKEIVALLCLEGDEWHCYGGDEGAKKSERACEWITIVAGLHNVSKLGVKGRSGAETMRQSAGETWRTRCL